MTLSAVSLHTGGLSPAVAFTALSILQRLESTFSLMPELLTDFINALVSFGRIEAYLDSPERIDDTIDAHTIAFHNATITWPSDAHKCEAFQLQDLDLEFPRHSLSIVAGPTGAGKSLLLQAIIGEAEILHGTVHRPKRVLDDSAEGMELFAGGWILPKHMALVAQVAWIENETLRKNILFGLPFSESRYHQVLEACALSQDIAEMPHKDFTELGSHGVNLSGGQRTRVTLARALYSRAEVLVMDDVFSAVDAHVGRHILEHALTGELMKDRTCIVATHHLQLCLPQASFVVMLDDRTAKYAGSAREFSKSSGLITLGASDASDASDEEDEEENGGSSEGSTSFLDEDQSVDSSAMDEYQPQAAPTMEETTLFEVDQESRQKGRIKTAVYKQYLGAASPWPWTYWLVVILLLFG
ncbi:MAG: hypothetical protein L6R37_000338 [Teloschistes peruensis]|nr:MAG: hypothetical protein L6R37_000338 [Teloschistes peruensis]